MATHHGHAVFARLEGKSTRQADEVLSACSLKPTTTKTLKVELSTEDYAKLEKLQSLLSHHCQGKAGSMAGILSLLINEGLEKHDPAQIETRRERRRTPAKTGAPQVICDETDETAPLPSSRHIPAAIRREVWLRDSGKCTHPGCGATKFLHYDHVQPFAFGGAHNANNLHLLCSGHHAVVTREVFGNRPWR